MDNLNFFITKKKIDYNKKLKYLITIPCVNREERNAINVIDRTFLSFEKSGLFNSDIEITIMLFESGSVDKSYLDFIETYREMYRDKKIIIINSDKNLNGISNTLRMFYYINKLPQKYDFIIWMDDDIFVSKNFIKNADIWIKNYANFSIFSSLYVPYRSAIIKNRRYVRLSNIHEFYGTCCTIFKPELAKYVIPYWYDDHFEKFNYNPDTRFRDSIRKSFPKIHKIFVSYPSLVEHMNIGSSIKLQKVVNNGHKALFFIGEDIDIELYLNDLINDVKNPSNNLIQDKEDNEELNHQNSLK